MYHHEDAPGNNQNGPRSAITAPIERRSAAEIIAAAMPDLVASDTAQQRRLQQALIDCRAGGAEAAQEQKLRVAFQLYDEELLTRGDICALFAIDVRQFLDYTAAYASVSE